MFLKKKKAAIPDAPRTTIQQTASLGVTPGQRILGLMTALVGSGLILGTIGYKYVYPALKGQPPQKPAASSQGAAIPPAAPKLNVPLDLNSAPEPPPTAGGVFPAMPPGLFPIPGPQPTVPPITAAGGTKPYPPGLSGTAGAGDAQGVAGISGGATDPAADVARQRKLQGELGSFGSGVFDPNGNQTPATAQVGTTGAAPATARQPASGANPNTPSALLQGISSGTTTISSLLNPTATPATSASYMNNQHLTLAKGASISCVLDTAIQTDQVGFVSCLTDYPIYSMDGKVVLAERGTKIEGEYARGMEKGMKAVFVLWSRARTPTGVIFNLASPGTDALGRAGIHGDVDNKFWERFGGALMFSMLQDSSQAVASKLAGQQGGSLAGQNVLLLPNTQQAGQNAISEILKQGGDIKPSLYKNQGDTVAITVARDIDFSPVYRLTAKAP